MKHSKRVLVRQASNRPCRRLKRPKSSLRHPGDYEINGTQGSSFYNPLPSTINQGEGRSDKIYLVWKMPLVICDTKEDVNSFILHLGGCPKDQRGEHDLFSKLFNVAPYNGDAKELKIRSKPLAIGKQTLASPLFSGRLKIYRFPLPQG